MNENGNFKEIDEKNERKRKCIESQEILQFNLFVFLFCSLSDDLCLFWTNEWNSDQMNHICNNIVQTVLFRSNCDWKFLSYKNSFLSIKIKGKIENERKRW